MLRDAEEMFAKSELWAWCERTRGLGPVAALTFMGYINPEKCATAGKFWAYCGYVPGAKMKSGERGNYNPELKGRFYVITRNVVMAQDPYYVALLNAKKQYYLTMRPEYPRVGREQGQGMEGEGQQLCPPLVDQAASVPRNPDTARRERAAFSKAPHLHPAEIC